jgi:hypothetical protein
MKLLAINLGGIDASVELYSDGLGNSDRARVFAGIAIL